MDKKRAIGGVLLSFAFLLMFSCLITGLQLVLKNGFDKNLAVASVSNAAQDAIIVSDTQENALPALPAPEINANAAISIESNLSDLNKVLLEKNSNNQFPIASLTKLMTAVIVLDNPENKYNFSDTILIDKIADSQSPLKIDIQAGDRLTVESLLDIMLIESSNKSAYALSESIGTPKFVELMNKKAKELNLNSTSFTDPTGLSSNDVSTASDLAKLAVYILSNKNYSRIANISKFEELDVPGFGKITNSDELLGEIPDIICSKTGFTNEANGCLLLVTSNPKNNDYLINVVLGTDDRFTEMQKLINWSNITCK